MDRMLIVTGIRCEPSTNAPTFEIEQIGFSLVHMMRLSEGAATGVRAELQIEDEDALERLETHYENNTELRWHFSFGGGANSLSVSLRWTKFNRESGYVQVVRTAVLRDLLGELDAGDSADAPGEQPDPVVANGMKTDQRPVKKKATAKATSSRSSGMKTPMRTIGENLSSLLQKFI